MRIDSDSYVQFMFHPLRNETVPKKILGLVGSIAVGVFTLGILHAVSAFIFSDKVFKKKPEGPTVDKVEGATTSIFPKTEDSQKILDKAYVFETHEDFSSAAKEYERAVALDNTQAMWRLGILYRDGKTGVPKDLEKAKKLFERARDLGDYNAMWTLGSLYEFGNGVGKDEAQARKLYLQASDLA